TSPFAATGISSNCYPTGKAGLKPGARRGRTHIRSMVRRQTRENWRQIEPVVGNLSMLERDAVGSHSITGTGCIHSTIKVARCITNAHEEGVKKIVVARKVPLGGSEGRTVPQFDDVAVRSAHGERL